MKVMVNITLDAELVSAVKERQLKLSTTLNDLLKAHINQLEGRPVDITPFLVDKLSGSRYRLVRVPGSKQLGMCFEPGEEKKYDSARARSGKRLTDLPPEVKLRALADIETRELGKVLDVKEGKKLKCRVCGVVIDGGQLAQALLEDCGARGVRHEFQDVEP